jgi:broad specificity phosphatase PhoE
MSFCHREGQLQGFRRLISSPTIHSSWSAALGTCFLLLSATAPVAHSLSMMSHAAAVTPRGKAFAASLPALKPFHRRLYLLRHGQTDWNQQGLMQGGGYDIPLNDNGKNQAVAVADELSAIPLGAMASSHLQRALQTANHVHAAIDKGLPRRVDPRWGEMRFGDFEGTCIHGPNVQAEHKAAFRTMMHAMQQDVTLSWPGNHGESTMEVSGRGQAAIQRFLEEFPDEDHLAVVAHGRFNKVLLATLLWKDASRYVEIEQGNTCINVIDYCDSIDQWNPILLNYGDHVAPDSTLKIVNMMESQQQQQQQPIGQFNATTTTGE